MLPFLNYIPEASQPYCHLLAEKYNFRFILKRKRLTKLGDFKNDKVNRQYIISVNKNLNQYQFLITFIHELAHLKVAKEHARSKKAHGKEWKDAFKELLQPLLRNEIFPEPLLSILIKHMANPKATAGSDPVLWNALLVYNQESTLSNLNSIADNAEFIFRKKQFTKIKKRRTRILCKEIGSGRLYLIPGIAEVGIL